VARRTRDQSAPGVSLGAWPDRSSLTRGVCADDRLELASDLANRLLDEVPLVAKATHNAKHPRGESVLRILQHARQLAFEMAANVRSAAKSIILWCGYWDGYPRRAASEPHVFTDVPHALRSPDDPSSRGGFEIAADVWMILPPSVLGSGRVNGADPGHTAIARQSPELARWERRQLLPPLARARCFADE